MLNFLASFLKRVELLDRTDSRPQRARKKRAHDFQDKTLSNSRHSLPEFALTSKTVQHVMMCSSKSIFSVRFRFRIDAVTNVERRKLKRNALFFLVLWT